MVFIFFKWKMDPRQKAVQWAAWRGPGPYTQGGSAKTAVCIVRSRKKKKMKYKEWNEMKNAIFTDRKKKKNPTNVYTPLWTTQLYQSSKLTKKRKKWKQMKNFWNEKMKNAIVTERKKKCQTHKRSHTAVNNTIIPIFQTNWRASLFRGGPHRNTKVNRTSESSQHSWPRAKSKRWPLEMIFTCKTEYFCWFPVEHVVPVQIL